jgi:hypothetical protein
MARRVTHRDRAADGDGCAAIGSHLPDSIRGRVEETEILNPRNTRKSWKVSNAAPAQHAERAEITWVNPRKHAGHGVRPGRQNSQPC